MKLNEKWKPVKGYEGLYEVSNLGNVRSLRFGKVKVLKIRPNSGYLLVDLRKDGKRKSLLVHRLVYTAFIGPITPGMTVDHINGIKTDNRVENLQLLSGANNTRKACNKQIDLLEAQYPHREYTFPSSVYASGFFRL